MGIHFSIPASDQQGAEGGKVSRWTDGRCLRGVPFKIFVSSLLRPELTKLPGPSLETETPTRTSDAYSTNSDKTESMLRSEASCTYNHRF